MNKNVVTEIVSFDIDESVSPETFKEIVNSVAINFHMLQAGYLDSELVKGKKNAWTIIMHWESLEEVKRASKLMMHSDLTTSFRQVVIPSSVRMGYAQQIIKWIK